MTGYLLIRHATAADVGHRLAGRLPGIHLNDAGREQALALARSLSDAPVSAVYTSPRERALETATPLARAVGVEAVITAAFEEVDFGEWTGRSFESLEEAPGWAEWNAFRSTARPPGGESTVEVLSRALRGVHEIGAAHEDEWVAVVSHSGVIRALLTHFAGMSLDHVLRLEVATGSISAVEVNPWGPRILSMNAAPGCLRCVPWAGADSPSPEGSGG